MGIDGRNTITIRGAKAVLDVIEATGLTIDGDPISERFFGKANIKVIHRESKLLIVDYEFRNGPIYDYLKLLISKYPTCWFKNIYHTEDGNCGMWIGRFSGDKLNIQELEWYELSYDEKYYETDFSKL